MKKIFSIITLVLTVGITAAPFIPKADCSAPCCEMAVQKFDTSEANNCDMSMKQCDYSLFIPLVAVQLDNTNWSANDPIGAIIIELPLEQKLSLTNFTYNIFTDAPPGHLFPLRV